MRSLPGDYSEKETLHRLLRVNHAGEYGAVQIYAGQQRMLRDAATRALVKHMAAQEKEHLENFNGWMRRERVRPSALLPLWHIGGFALGALTAMLGPRGAHACTVAVESVIDTHYEDQKDFLRETNPSLADTVSQFQADEKEHHDTSLQHGAEKLPGYPVIYAAVQRISRISIWLATRI